MRYRTLRYRFDNEVELLIFHFVNYLHIFCSFCHFIFCDDGGRRPEGE